jgi:hypothetical protein
MRQLSDSQLRRIQPLKESAARQYDLLLSEAVENGGLADNPTYQAWRKIVREFHRAVSLCALEEGDQVRGPDGSTGIITGVDVAYQVRVRWETAAGESVEVPGSLSLVQTAPAEYRAESWA